ncbi:MAG: Fe-S cluster assembly scaffold protein NifU [bacterium]
MKYSAKVMDHFSNPRNVGTLESADGIGEVGNPACGDIMRFFISVKEGKIEDVRFQTFGCGAAIAVSSMISEMAKGKTLEEALEISNKDVAEALDGLPTNKLHCSNLGADALHAAIRDYYGRNGGIGKRAAESAVRKDPHGGEGCRCPYCDLENPAGVPICKSCGSRL